MNFLNRRTICLLVFAANGWLTTVDCLAKKQNGPVLLNDQFELPEGFHIYRAAPRELSGGSYAMAIDGQGRLLVGEGNSIRRLTDTNGDQVYDNFETIVDTGIQGRGPQGILVRGDRLYAVGGDGLQLYTGYLSGKLKHQGRLGEEFPTGGDHAAHMLVRGLDDWIYFITGDGGGNSEKHVTMEGSPVSKVRGASVYRLNSTGEHWECIGSGGRNAPGLGMNYLGELFSFDSDLEYTHGLPTYRPTRLIHWTAGAIDGWMQNDEGGIRPYFPDLQRPVIEIGRGTPTMGTFYEHTQFPERYRDAFVCCDYVWKGGGGSHHRSTGRVVVFHLGRHGGAYQAKMTTLVDGRADSKEQHGGRINLAAVDVIVAPDGSLLISDHGQGVWRVFYDERSDPPIPPLAAALADRAASAQTLLTQILTLPQPGSEFTRTRQDALLKALPDAHAALREAAIDLQRPLRERLRAIRILAPGFRELPADWLASLAEDREAEIRAQAAWLYGIRRDARQLPQVVSLLDDKDGLVRRRACEALMRLSGDQRAIVDAAVPLVKRLGDPDRQVRYSAMLALEHIPHEHWIEAVLASDDPQILVRGVIAAHWIDTNFRQQWVEDVLDKLVDRKLDKENRLDMYRLVHTEVKRLGAYVQRTPALVEHIFGDFPSPDDDIRWEQLRLAKRMQRTDLEPKLIEQLRVESHPVMRLTNLFALSDFPPETDAQNGRRLIQWLVQQQKGELNDPSTKGVHYPGYLKGIICRLADRYPGELAAVLDETVPGSFLADGVYLAVARSSPDGVTRLVKRLGSLKETSHQAQLVEALRESKLTPDQVSQLVELLGNSSDGNLINYTQQTIVRQQARLADLGDLARQQALVDGLLNLALANRHRTGHVDQILSHLTDQKVEGLDKSNLDGNEQLVATEHWLLWYRQQFGHPLAAKLPTQAKPLPDEEIHRLILASQDQGDSLRGRAVYLRSRCYACHGGGGTNDKANTFGPALTGVTRQLKPAEMAEALVYPSKKVDDRFRSTAIVTTKGQVIRGFLTQKSDESVTLVEPEGQLHVLPTSQIDEIGFSPISPMPEGLLRYLTASEINDLMAYLRSL